MIPVEILPPGQNIEQYEKEKNIDSSVYYVLTDDGMFLRKRNGMYSCTHKAESTTQLGFGKAEETLQLRCPPVPWTLMQEIVDFLAEVCRRWKAEGVALLYYCAQRREWTYLVPEQVTQRNGLAVTYDVPVESPDGFVLFGSVHSHAESSAFQSGTDHKDEFHFEGVHITVGHLPYSPEFHARFHACGSKWDFKDTSLLMEPPPPPKSISEEIMSKVSVESGYTGVIDRRGWANEWDDSDWLTGQDRKDKKNKKNKKKHRKPKEAKPWDARSGIYCTKQQAFVPPESVEDDSWLVGQKALYEGRLYVKTEFGWFLANEAAEMASLIMGDN